MQIALFEIHLTGMCINKNVTEKLNQVTKKEAKVKTFESRTATFSLFLRRAALAINWMSLMASNELSISTCEREWVSKNI